MSAAETLTLDDQPSNSFVCDIDTVIAIDSNIMYVW